MKFEIFEITKTRSLRLYKKEKVVHFSAKPKNEPHSLHRASEVSA
ncbi:MAG: hypothetical protein U5L45_07455 [Saprospiraceae bacterium]|nr:hypothetical protein [Saprospiraceae bacterium]